MAVKTANVMARIEPDLKEKAEDILDNLGIPASVVINMLYKQIVLTRSIPFPLSLPAAPVSLDEMDDAAFDAMMQDGLDDAKANRSLSLAEAMAELRRGL